MAQQGLFSSWQIETMSFSGREVSFDLSALINIAPRKKAESTTESLMYSEAHEFLEDKFELIESLRDVVIDSIDMLSEQDRYIIEAIVYEQITFDELSKRLGVSSVHAWRLYKGAQEKLKTILLNNSIITDYLNG